MISNARFANMVVERCTVNTSPLIQVALDAAHFVGRHFVTLTTTFLACKEMTYTMFDKGFAPAFYVFTTFAKGYTKFTYLA